MNATDRSAVFVDIDTQIDFLFPAGALYAAGAERIAANLSALTQFAAAGRIPILSTADAHSENDPEFALWKPHCVVDTTGQAKLASTRLPGAYVVSSQAAGWDANQAAASGQLIIEKQHVDCFTNRHFAPIAASFGDVDFVVYGLVTEVCVFHAAAGLMARGHSVLVISDAITGLNQSGAIESLRTLSSRGARLVTTEEVLAAYAR